MNRSDELKKLIESKKPECVKHLRAHLVNDSYTFISWCLGHKFTRDKIYDFEVFMPEFGVKLQRDYGKWTIEDKQKYIGCLLDMDVTISNVIVSRDITNDATIYKVIDGQHHLQCIREFVTEKFPFEFCGKSFYYSEISGFFNSRANRLVFEIHEEEALPDLAKCVLFYRVNFAGYTQEKAKFDQINSIIKSQSTS